jgi:integrase
MPSGACVIRREGVRGAVWSVKFVDADGRQVKERLGPEAEGWTRRKAQRELRHRLADVERKGWRKPKALTFQRYAEAWFAEGEKRRRWKASTVAQYRSVRQRLVDEFGPLPLDAIRPRHVAAYIAEMSDKYGPSIVSRDVSVLHAILRTAQREELVDSNAATAAERPKLPRREWRILQPQEVGRVARAFTDEQSRTVFWTLFLTGVRREELRRLRWRDVDLVETVLRVRDAKSERGVRAIALAPMLAEMLWQHRRRSAFQGDDELVFCHKTRGTPLVVQAYEEAFRAALTAAGITDRIRCFHDLRHASLTNGAAAGETPIALMTRAGHANMATTQNYLHLAGVVFRDEAQRLEERFGAELGTELGTDLREPQST